MQVVLWMPRRGWWRPAEWGVCDLGQACDPRGKREALGGAVSALVKRSLFLSSGWLWSIGAKMDGRRSKVGDIRHAGLPRPGRPWPAPLHFSALARLWVFLEDHGTERRRKDGDFEGRSSVSGRGERALR